MFTGLVTAVGVVRNVERRDSGLALTIGAPYTGLALGESIAVSGACLTVERKGRGWFAVHVVSTSLERTRLGSLGAGERVNLERALRAGDRLGGHLVQGHVDGVATVRKRAFSGDALLLDLEVPDAVNDCTVMLGSITVDGVSLTVNALPEPGVVQVSLIPFTRDHTTLGGVAVGDALHVEGDTVGKYVRALGPRGPGTTGSGTGNPGPGPSRAVVPRERPGRAVGRKPRTGTK
ncbi:MAG: riboflavin synthase [Gemmatimonadota bacterium]